MALYDSPKRLTLFGGDRGWHAGDWTASDDRVRGGRSQSYLDCSEKLGRFHGKLDIKTLGGAGFASQRTVGDARVWDLSEYAGVQISIAKGDKKRYTFILKDDILPRDPDSGREQASVSWEVDFDLPPQTEPGDTHDQSVFIPWKAFNPTYRGKPQKHSKPLQLRKIKRMSIMMRSFFGSQEGDFSLSMRSIRALSEVPSLSDRTLEARQIDVGTVEKGVRHDAETGLLGDAHSNAGSRKADVRLHKRRFAWICGAVCLLGVYFFVQQTLCRAS